MAEEYKSSLADLTFNSKPLINMLTMLAEDGKEHAEEVVMVIQAHIQEAAAAQKLPALYLIDSIIKNVRDSNYKAIFAQHIVSIFVGVFEKVDEKTRQSMWKLRQTWADIFPNKKLYSLDMTIAKIDPAWPITAQPEAPAAKIHVNPRFLKKQQEEEAKLLEIQRQEELRRQKELKRQQEEELARREAEELTRQREEELTKRMEEFNHQRELAIRIQQEQEQQVQQQLLTKQQELLKLKQQQLEIELQIKKQQLREQEMRQQAVLSQQIESAQEQLKKQQAQIEQPIAAADPSKRDPRLRDPRLGSRDPRTGVGSATQMAVVTPQQQQPHPVEKPSTKVAPPVVNLVTASHETESVVAEPKPKKADTSKTSKRSPPRLDSKISLSDKKASSKTNTAATETKAEPKVNPERKSSTDSKDDKRDKERRDRGVERETRRHSTRVAGRRRNSRGSSPTMMAAPDRKRKSFESRSRSRSPRRSRSRSPRRSPRRKAAPDEKHPKRSRRGRRDEERNDEKPPESKTLDTDGAAGRLRKRGTPPRKSPDKKESAGKALVKYKSLLHDDPPKKKPKQDESPNAEQNISDNKLPDEFAELFGKEDMDYRQIPPGDIHLSVDTTMQPVDQSPDSISPSMENLPREEGWAQFKASKPEQFPFKQPRRTSLPEAIYDTDLRLRAPPMSPAVSQQQGPKSEWSYPVSHAQRDIDIPTPLLLDKAENVLEQANYQLRSGKLTHSQHQELLKQLSELYRLQKLKQKLHKFDLGEDQEIPMKMEDLDQFLRRGYKLPTRLSDSFEEQSDPVTSSQSNDGRSPHASPTAFKPPEPVELHPQNSPKALPLGQESEPTCDKPSESFRVKDNIDAADQNAMMSRSRPRESDEGRRDYADGRPLRPLDNRDRPDQYRPPPPRLRPPRDDDFKPHDFDTDFTDSQFYFPSRDMRWFIKSMRSSKRDTTCLVVVDNKRFELRNLQIVKNVRVDGRMVGIRADIASRQLYFNDELVYRFGDPPRDLQWNGIHHSVFFQGPSRNIWIDGQHFQICLDAPPTSINIGGKEHEISVNCATCQVIIDGRSVCPYGGDTSLIKLGPHSFEISFQPLARRILVDQEDRELDLTGEYPAIIIEGRRHGIQFKGPAREVLINRQSYRLLPDMPRKIPIFGKRLYHVALGGPAHEIIIDDQWYEVKFGGPEKFINLGDKTVRIQLPDGPPGVKILGEMLTLEDIPRRLPKHLVRKLLGEMQFGGRLDSRNASNGTSEDYAGYRLGPIDGTHSKDQDLRKSPALPRDWATTTGIPKLLELDVHRPGRNHGGHRLADEDIRPRMHPDAPQAGTPPRPPQFDHVPGEAVNMESGRNVPPRLDGRFSREDPRRLGYYGDRPIRSTYEHQLPLRSEQPHEVRGVDPAQNARVFGESIPREAFETGQDQAGRGLGQDSQVLPDGRLHGTDRSIAPMKAPPLPPTAISLTPDGAGVSQSGVQAFQMSQPSLSQGIPMSNSQLMPVQSSQSSVMTTAGYSMPVPMPPLPPGMGLQLPGYNSQNPPGGMFMNPSPAAPYGQMTAAVAAPTINTQIDVNSLFSQLVASGIISGKDKEQKKQEAPKEEKTQKVEKVVKPEVKAPPEIVIDKIPDLTKFNSDALKKSYKGVIQALYSGIQCSSCGMRFVAEDTDNYREHLDWHFRQNKREKDGVKVAKFRRWYYEISDWIQYEELGDLEERAQSQFFETMLASVHHQLNQTYNQHAPAALVSCPAAGDNESDDSCAICGEQFEQFWDEEEEEWHLRDAIRADGKTYHPVCYEDLKENSVIETPTSASCAETEPLAAVSAQPEPVSDTSTEPKSLPDPILNPIAYLTQIMAPSRTDAKSVSPVAKLQEPTSESPSFTGIPALSISQEEAVQVKEDPTTADQSESAVVKAEPETKVLANCEAAGTVSVGSPVVKNEAIVKEEATDTNDNTNTSQNS